MKKTTTTVLTKDDIAEKLTEEDEEEHEEIHKDYKHLDVAIDEMDTNEYVVHVLHQSHGFMNYMISKVLSIKGVTYAAYKLTSLEPPKMRIRPDGSKDIKAVLKEVAKKMNIELKGLANAIKDFKI